ncbi:uncharacterized protein PAF06_004844 [Gastrophryne carolinensis]
MAAGSASLPWLERTRSQIQNLQEWKEFIDELYDGVQQQMNESNIKFFNDLSESEKIFILEKGAKALHSGAIYNKLASHISLCLEENIYSNVAQELQDGSVPRRQSDLVDSHIQEGVISILEKRPSLKVKLHILFNQPLPVALRALTWKLQLSNPKAHMEYVTRVSLNKTRSILERDIALHCETLLSQGPTLQHLNEDKRMGRCMRNVLSYYHKLSKLSLSEEHYLLLVPLVQVILATSKPSTTAESMTALLVEQYVALLDSRPTIMCQNHNNKVTLNVIHMSAYFPKPVTDAEDAEDTLLLGIQRILQPVFQVLFVGYLDMTTLLYAWDQHILGVDEPSYNCLPALGVTFLLLLRGRISECRSHSNIEEALRSGGPTLSVQEFQMMINKHFYQDLYNALNKGETNQVPAHDAATSHWTYVSKLTTTSRTRPQDRRKAREEREMLRKQAAEKEYRENQIRLQQEEEQRRQEEERLNRLLEDTRRKFEIEKADLQNQLMQEQQQNYELEKRASKQIKDLQSEVTRLLQKRRRSSAAPSIESILAPPPSINSQTPPQGRLTDTPLTPEHKEGKLSGFKLPLSSATVREVNGKKASTVMLDLLKHMMDSADMLINGQTVAERDTLNEMTRRHMMDYQEDVKNAQIEVFGRELESNELDLIEEPKRSAISKRLSQAIKRRTEARYVATMKGSRQKLPDNVVYTNTL